MLHESRRLFLLYKGTQLFTSCCLCLLLSGFASNPALSAEAGPIVAEQPTPSQRTAQPQKPVQQPQKTAPSAAQKAPAAPKAGQQSTVPSATAPAKSAESAPEIVAAPESSAGTTDASAQPVRRGTAARVIPGASGGSSFFFDDADIFEVAQTVFGDVLKLNYVIDPQVKGRVNFRTSAPISRAKILPVMEIILRLSGAGVVEESGLYRIIPIENIAREPAPMRFGNDPNSVELKGTALIQIVPLMYINSSEMMSILNPLLTPGGAMYDLQKRNVLMIADTDANVRRLLQAIQMFDRDNYQTAYAQKIYVYPLQNSKAEHVARILQSLLLGGTSSSAPSGGKSSSVSTASTAVRSVTASASKPATGLSGTPSQQPSPPQASMAGMQASGDAIVAPMTKIYPDDVTNSLVIYASPGDYALIIAAIKQLDSTPRQVMIEAIVASVELTDNLTFGVKWNLGKVKMSPFDQYVKGPLGFSNLPNPFAAGGSTSTFAYTGLDSSNTVRLAIEALAEDNKAKILSSPHILVADNREARIQVGTQIPIATATTTTPIGTGSGTVNTTSSSIQYKDTGTILRVKPQVNDSGLISLEIGQEVSSAKTVPVLGTDQFVISKSEVLTNLVAQDGQTIVIGGLVTETEDFSRSGIPGLSKIPILGYLFGQTTDKTTRQELIILLTPRVLRNQADAARVSSEYREEFRNLDRALDTLRLRKTKSSQKSDLQPTGSSPAAPAPAATEAQAKPDGSDKTAPPKPRNDGPSPSF